MRLLIINPNSTAAMTATIAVAAREAASNGTSIVAVNPADTPPAIEGPVDGEACLPGLFATFDREMASGSYDAVIIACFDDTGVRQLKQRSPVPVIGIGEAAYHCAMLVADRFCVVTTLAVSVPVLEQNLVEYGIAQACTGVHASGIAVLAIEHAMEAAANAIAAEAQIALRNERCEAVVLGCAGMAGLAQNLSARLDVPVVDGVAAAVLLCEASVRLARLTRWTRLVRPDAVA
jgi:allantoin racemase